MSRELTGLLCARGPDHDQDAGLDGFDSPNRTDYYYNTSWQVLEERFYDGANPYTTVATDVSCQYVWDPRYIDAPVCRDKDVDDDEDCTETDWDTGDDPDEHLYYCQDANFNTTALVERSDGSVVERYVYDPYGKVTIYDDDWSDTVTWGNSKKNEVLYCGYRYDHEGRLYHVRYRSYHPTLGRWMQRDPIGYADGMSLYQYSGSRPTVARDPTGLKWWDPAISSRVIACRGDITIDFKEIYKWYDIIRDMFSWNPNIAPGKKFDQSCDFTVSVRTDWEIVIKVVGYAPVTGDYEDGTVANIGFSTYGFEWPTDTVIGPNRDKPLSGKLCRKAVYVRQECCVERSYLWGGSQTNWEDRYVRVYLYGQTVQPQNTLPSVLECDVSASEEQLSTHIQSLNKRNHCMCTEGLDMEGFLILEVDGGLRSSMRSSTVPYVKGEHDPLILHANEEYEYLR